MKKLLLLLFVFVLAAGCAKDDTEDPTISVATPIADATFTSGQEINFSATFADDNLLSSYKIEIDANFENSPIDAWSESIDGDLEDKLKLVEQSIAIPENIAAGEYTMTVKCTDDAGKDAEDVSVVFNISNVTDTAAPSLMVSSPDPDLTLNLDVGATFTVAGNVVDDALLSRVTISILDADGTVLSDEVVEIDGVAHDFSKNFPAPADPGTYTVEVEAVDAVNNRTVVDITLIVS